LVLGVRKIYSRKSAKAAWIFELRALKMSRGISARERERFTLIAMFLCRYTPATSRLIGRGHPPGVADIPIAEFAPFMSVLGKLLKNIGR